MIVIIDYGMGNLRSIYKALKRLEIEAKISANVHDIEAADRLILPGVGHFGRGMQNLRDMGLLEVLTRKVIEEKTPILGICLGMQLFCKSSEEGASEGLGWLNAKTVRFDVQDKSQYKVPHVGWNSLAFRKEQPLFSGLQNQDLFYFVHSYHLVCHEDENVLSSTTYDYPFVSAVQKDNIFGTQFHPEKSRRIGLRILRNFSEGM